ncbi:MAG TPA: hypothetical protein VGQ57_09515 [Polyangiaceae bacterium]|jgi:hypothetical protein|nr:hypothetical protein [Polyangiaceae bacterium]
MPGFLLDEDAEVKCAHPPPGSATPLSTNRRLKVDGKSTIVVLDQYSIAGCPLNTPCTAGGFISGAARLMSGGQPLVLTSSPSTSVPNGSPLRVVSSQQRVKGS